MSSKPEAVKVGTKIWFAGERKPFTVKACDDRYAICTQPFNLKKTVYYTIIDFDKDIRGPNDYIFNIYDYTKQNDIDQCLKDLNRSENPTCLSRRRSVELHIIKTENQK